MSKYDKLIKENKARRENVQDQQRIIKGGMGEMAADARRTATILGNAHDELSEIDAQFLRSTRLESREDIAFLMLATALQIGRWEWLDYFFLEWSDLEEELLKKCFARLEKKGAFPNVEGWHYKILPFMRENGYRDGSGWWIKETNLE